MKTYELSYIISPEITSEEAETKAKEIESAVATREGVILKQSNPVAKTLSYPIEKRASGFFGFLEFQLEPEKLLELKEIIEKDGKVVRHMLIIKKPQRIRRERVRKQVGGSETLILEKPETQLNKEPATTHAEVAEEQKKPETKGKVELKDIEHELEEILG